MTDENISSDANEKAQEYIRELQQLRKNYDTYIDQEVIPLFQDDRLERRPPRRFEDSSLLYIRSFDGDDGSRPFSGQVFWISPDIQVSPVSNLAAYTHVLNAGETYNLRCHVRNRGDRTVPAAKVEFWLADPSLGLDTRFAQHLTLGRVASTWINSNTTGFVEVTYTIPPTESGHKCLFARVFSFSPLDIPIHDTLLDPTIDRHIAQLNLNIIQQGQPYQFNWVHARNAEQWIEFIPLAANQLLTMRHPLLAEFAPAEEFPRDDLIRRAALNLADLGGTDLELAHEGHRLRVVSRDQAAPDVMSVREVRQKIQHVLREINAGRTSASEHKDLFSRWREMNSQSSLSVFKMHIPDLGLRESQVVAMHIQAREMEEQGEVQGGLTVLITG